MTVLVVQRVVTTWTKESRGGPEAARRSATPSALPLPVMPAAESGAVVHFVTLAEQRAFAPTEEAAVCQFADLPRFVPELELRADGDDLQIRFVWGGPVGAPERARGAVTRLRPGEWCRVLHNGRFPEESTWSYQSTVLNVANGASRLTFVETSPRVVDDHRAALW